MALRSTREASGSRTSKCSTPPVMRPRPRRACALTSFDVLRNYTLCHPRLCPQDMTTITHGCTRLVKHALYKVTWVKVTGSREPTLTLERDDARCAVHGCPGQAGRAH